MLVQNVCITTTNDGTRHKYFTHPLDIPSYELVNFIHVLQFVLHPALWWKWMDCTISSYDILQFSGLPRRNEIDLTAVSESPRKRKESSKQVKAAKQSNKDKCYLCSKALQSARISAQDEGKISGNNLTSSKDVDATSKCSSCGHVVCDMCSIRSSLLAKVRRSIFQR